MPPESGIGSASPAPAQQGVLDLSPAGPSPSSSGTVLQGRVEYLDPVFCPPSASLNSIEDGFGSNKPGDPVQPCPPKEKKPAEYPEFLESLIPVWGSARQAQADFDRGETGWGWFNTILAITDIIPARTIGGLLVKGGGKLAVKLGLKGVLDDAAKVIAKQMDAVRMALRTASAATHTRILSGMTQEAFDAFSKIAKENNVVIRMRPTNPASARWLKQGYSPKPVFLKNKTVNEIDVLLDPNLAGKEGLVGCYKPQPPDFTRIQQQLGRELTNDETRALYMRYYDRTQEWVQRLPELEKRGDILIKDGLVYDMNKGLHPHANPPTGFGKPYTGDYDAFDIRKLDAAGKLVPIDEASDPNLYWKVTQEMQNHPHIAAQHPDLMSYKPATPADVKIKQDIFNKGEDLVHFAPDGASLVKAGGQ